MGRGTGDGVTQHPVVEIRAYFAAQVRGTALSNKIVFALLAAQHGGDQNRPSQILNLHRSLDFHLRSLS